MTNPETAPLVLTRHASQALGTPAVLEVEPGLIVLRFESMKILSARAAVQNLLELGTIRPGDTVIDSSSGIYAYALAVACHEFGVRCRIIGSTTIDAALAAQLLILGADLEPMPPSTSLELDQHRRVARVREHLARHPGWHWMQQYHDPIHRLGYLPVGAQLARLLQTEGHAAARLVGPVGSGVSTAALTRGMRGAGMPTGLIGVQPFGSITFGSGHVDDPDMLIAGIGSSIEFGNVEHDLYASIHWISFQVARAGAVSLLRDHAVFAGLSSGAAYAAALHERGAATRPAGGTATVMVAPDTGHRYVEAVFADAADVPDVRTYTPHATDVRGSPGSGLRLPWTRSPWNTPAPPPSPPSPT